MSLVICVCNTDYSVMVGDTRMIEFDAYGNQIRIVNEDTRKVFKINADIAIGYTGDPIPAQIALQKLDTFRKDGINIEQAKNIIRESLMESPANELGVKIIISGKNIDGQMNLYVLDTKEGYEYNEYPPTQYSPSFACSAHDMRKATIILKKYINESIKQKSEYELVEHLKKCIIELSETDDSVNNNVQEVVIK